MVNEVKITRMGNNEREVVDKKIDQFKVISIFPNMIGFLKHQWFYSDNRMV